MLDVLATLKKPVVTEKSTQLQERNQYVFEIAATATKAQVREAVERAFDVKVQAVRTMWIRGRRGRFGPTRRLVKLADVKKAVVTLRPGDIIQLFEGA